MTSTAPSPTFGRFRHRHLLGIEGLSPDEISLLLDLADGYAEQNRLPGLTVAICGDILHSRVARSNIHLLAGMGARVRVIGPPTLVPATIDRLGVEVFHDMKAGLKDCDIVMMLRLQLERMHGAFVP